MARMFASLNYITVTFDMRGVNKSSGQCSWTGHDEVEDVCSVARYVQAHLRTEEGSLKDKDKDKDQSEEKHEEKSEKAQVNEDKCKIVVIGSSAGAPIAGSAVHELVTQEIANVVAYIGIGYPFGVMASVIFGGHYKNIIGLKDLPKLFIQGDSDGFTSPQTLKKTVSSCNSEVVIVEGGIGHFELEGSAYDDVIVDHICSFLSNKLINKLKQNFLLLMFSFFIPLFFLTQTHQRGSKKKKIVENIIMLAKKAVKRTLSNPTVPPSKKSKVQASTAVDSFLSDDEGFEEVGTDVKEQDIPAMDNDIDDMIQQSLEKESNGNSHKNEEEEEEEINEGLEEKEEEEDEDQMRMGSFEAETDEFELLLQPKRDATGKGGEKKKESSKTRKDDKFHLSDSEDSEHDNENAEYRKAKRKEQGMDNDKEEEEEEEEEEELLDIEKQAKEEDMLQEQIKSDVKEDWKYMIDTHSARKKTYFIFPSKKKLIEEKNSPMDLKLLKKRIQDLIEILCNFKQLRDGNHSRKEYMSVLSHSMARYYGYSLDLMNLLLTIFPPNECMAFVESNEKTRPLTIRCNTLKCRRRELAKNLIERGVNLDPLAEWTKEGLTVIDTQVPIGATPEYLAGYYMVQSAASLLPVMALDVRPGQMVLDVAAAPGGKSTHIGQLMKNSGTLVCNDSNRERLKAVFGNIHRMGINNSIIINEDGRRLHHRFHAVFDRVLLDAPCSCIGVISRDPQIKHNKTFKDITTQCTLQQELILSAIDCLRPGGILVYSTCSISIHENESVVQFALTNRPVRIIETGLSFGVSGFTRFKHFQFHPSMKLTKRYYPHTHNMDGFFVAKLQKTDKAKHGSDKVTLTDTLIADKKSTNKTNGHSKPQDKAKSRSASATQRKKQRTYTKSPKSFTKNAKPNKSAKKNAKKQLSTNDESDE
ncbi:nucleolar protein [Reticulomyxa filosa]|uniref:Nucleolar protein n=1 Tax=Reticulomyxa filosa TaxID=46433 RepID=X6NRV3_RETFI|nr:nucleolar protein [Reticulomyxa filosa]|eukprot:ETO29010.1 nucleolar protein [Reticulomyxa filosa]